jgi:hypothetical protein
LTHKLKEGHLTQRLIDKNVLRVAGIFLLSAAVFVPAYGGPAPTGPGPAWATLAPVPAVGSGVEGPSVAAVGNRIIVALGLDPAFGDTNITRIYTIASDSWAFGADAPGTSSEGAGVAHGGIFYTLGGREAGPRADIWAYDPALDAWNAALAPMPTPRAGLAAAVVGNSIFAIGGRSNTSGPCSGNPVAAVERFDIAFGTWTTVASLPAPRSDLAAAAVGGKIYVFGGCDDAGNFLADVDVYDPETNTWSTAPSDMPTARAGMYAVETKGGTVYVIGGWDGVSNGLSTNEAFNVAQDTWTAGLLPMPTNRAETGAAGVGGLIYIVGGAQPGFGNSVNANEAFKP